MSDLTHGVTIELMLNRNDATCQFRPPVGKRPLIDFYNGVISFEAPARAAEL